MFTVEFKDSAGCREEVEGIVGYPVDIFADKFIRTIIAHNSRMSDFYKKRDAFSIGKNLKVSEKLGPLAEASRLISIEGTCVTHCVGGENSAYYILYVYYRLDCGSQRGELTVLTQFIVNPSLVEPWFFGVPGLMWLSIDGVDISFDILGTFVLSCSLGSDNITFSRSEEFS